MLPIHQTLSEASDCDIAEHDVTEREENKTLIDNFTMCQDCQASLESSESVYMEYEVVESAEEPEYCSIMIVKEDAQGKNETAIQSCTRKEGEHEDEEMCDSSSTNSEDSNDDLSDVDIGEVGLDDILEAERTEDKDGRQILKEFEHGNIFGDESVGSLNSSSTSTTPHYPSGLKICRDTSPFFDADWDVEETEAPKINGVEVRMGEVDLTDAEIDFYSDRVYGLWRTKQPSRLRVCWIPVWVDEGC